MSTLTFRFGVRPICLALSLAVVTIQLPACSTPKTAAQIANADTCKPQREAFRGYDDYFGKSMLVGAGIGAVAGGLIGYAIKQDAKAALAGMAVGAAAGAAGGYYQALSQQKADRQAQTAQVLTDVGADNEKITAIQAAFDTLVACRRGQAETIRADYKGGKLPRDQAEEAMKTVKRRYDDDVTFAQKIDGKIAERSANFQFATEQLTPQPYFASAANTPVYSATDVQSKVVTRLKVNAPIQAMSQDENWLQVGMPGGGTAYVMKSAVTAGPPPVVAAAPAPAASTGTKGKPAPTKGKGATPTPATTTTQVATAAPAAPASNDPLTRSVFTNVTKRTDFGNSIKTAAASSGGFELGT